MTYADEEEILIKALGRKGLKRMGIRFDKLGVPPPFIMVGDFFRALPEPEETLEERVKRLEDEVRRLKTERKPSIKPTKADLIYEKFREELEKEHFGKIVAIDVDSETIASIGDTVLEAYHKAKEKSQKTKFSYKRIGYKYVYRL